MRPWNSITLADDFMFKTVFSDADLCRELLETILGIPIAELTYIDTENDVKLRRDARSIKLDVRIIDAVGNAYDVEMQNQHRGGLGRRARFYGDMLDLSTANRGTSWRDLTNSYTIFVCAFDPFGFDLDAYTFRNTCVEIPGLELDDGTSKIFLNGKLGRTAHGDGKLAAFLDYIASNGVIIETDFIKRVDYEVQRIRLDKGWRDQHMKLEDLMLDYLEDGRELGREIGLKEGRAEGRAKGLEEGREAGRAEGRAEGHAEGRAEGLQQGRHEGEERLSTLISMLIEHGRVEDVSRVAQDVETRKSLYAEFGV